MMTILSILYLWFLAHSHVYKWLAQFNKLSCILKIQFLHWIGRIPHVQSLFSLPLSQFCILKQFLKPFLLSHTKLDMLCYIATMIAMFYGLL